MCFQSFKDLIWRANHLFILKAQIIWPCTSCLIDRVIIETPRRYVAHGLRTRPHLLRNVCFIILKFMRIFLLEYIWTDSLAFELSQIRLIWILTNFCIELLCLIIVCVYILMERLSVRVFHWWWKLRMHTCKQIVKILLVQTRVWLELILWLLSISSIVNRSVYLKWIWHCKVFDHWRSFIRWFESILFLFDSFSFFLIDTLSLRFRLWTLAVAAIGYIWWLVTWLITVW